MKATIKWHIAGSDRRCQKTFEVEKNEPNHIVNRARDNAIVGRWDFITTIKCGRTEYQWFGEPNY